MTGIKLYCTKTKRTIGAYKFIKAKSAYFVKFEPDYLHDDVYIKDIEQYKRDKGFKTAVELGW